jgi:hypothetical protein
VLPYHRPMTDSWWPRPSRPDRIERDPDRVVHAHLAEALDGDTAPRILAAGTSTAAFVARV